MYLIILYEFANVTMKAEITNALETFYRCITPVTPVHHLLIYNYMYVITRRDQDTYRHTASQNESSILSRMHALSTSRVRDHVHHE